MKVSRSAWAQCSTRVPSKNRQGCHVLGGGFEIRELPRAVGRRVGDFARPLVGKGSYGEGLKTPRDATAFRLQDGFLSRPDSVEEGGDVAAWLRKDLAFLRGEERGGQLREGSNPVNGLDIDPHWRMLAPGEEDEVATVRDVELERAASVSQPRLA